ncbi:MAG: glycosyltransferase [bacterium]
MNIADRYRWPKWLGCAWLLGNIAAWPASLFGRKPWILLIHLGSLGDGLLFTGGARALRRCLPGRKIVLVTAERAYPVWCRCPHVDRVISFGVGGATGWRASLKLMMQALQLFARRYETVLCPTAADGEASDFMARSVVSRRRFIMDYRAMEVGTGTTPAAVRSVAYADSDRVHELDRNVHFLQAAGIAGASSRRDIWPETYVSAAERARATAEVQEIRQRLPGAFVVALCAGARFKQKDWGAANYIELIRSLARERPVAVVLLGAEVDHSVADKIEAGLAGVPGVVVRNKVGRTELYYSVALIEQSDACVGNDTFGLHAAIAVGTPSVVVMWGGDRERWAPWGDPLKHRMVRSADHACFGCHGACTRGRYECMLSITVDDVLAEILAIVVNEGVERQTWAASVAAGAKGRVPLSKPESESAASASDKPGHPHEKPPDGHGYLRIGLFTSIQGWGGSEMYLLSFASALLARGHEVVLFGSRGSQLWAALDGKDVLCVDWRDGTVTGRCGKDEPSASAQADGREATLGGPLPRRGGPRSGLKMLLLWAAPGWVRLAIGNLAETQHLRRVFRRHPVDVMHVNVHGYEMAGLACRLSGIPCVGVYCTSTVHEPWWFLRLLIRFTAHTYRRVIGKSSASLAGWQSECHLPAEKCRMVWNGIDVERYAAGAGLSNNRKPGDQLRILAVGRLHRMKGYEHLLYAIKMLGDRNIMLTIAGEGDEEGVLKALATTLGVAARVDFRGSVEDVRILHMAADVFVMPSVSHESFGSALVEAMAAGLPVISSDFGPFLDINVHGVTGLIVPAGDSRRLAQAIKQLSEDPELCRRMGAAGQDRARRLFSRERMVDEMLGEYWKVRRA